MNFSPYGWAGCILRVDLSTGRVAVEPTEDYASNGIGARGIGQWILFHELEPPLEPLEPGSKLILGAGPLVGTLAPTSARLSVDGMNVLTGGASYSNVGGHFAPELKYAGFDSVVIEGCAERPVVLEICDGEARLREAGHLWGRTTWDAASALREELGGDGWQVATIGPAGENLVRGACIIIGNKRAAGRGGSGAVMGSKLLKAVAVRGSGAIRIHDPERFLTEVERCRGIINRSAEIRVLRECGTHGAFAAGGYYGTVAQPVRNYNDEDWDEEKTARIKEQVFKERWETRRLSCFNCPIYWSHFYRIEEGPFAGTACEGMDTNTVRAFGSNLDIDFAPALLKAQALVSQLGLDVDMCAASIAMAFELYERGIIGKGDTGGLELTWGNYEAALALVEQIGHRQGLGDVLAEGAKRAAEALGSRAEQFAMHIKGAGLNEAGMRYNRAWAFGITTSTRGGGHLDGAPTLPFLGIISEQGEALCGVPTANDPLVYEDNAPLVIWFENMKAGLDMVGLCDFTCPTIDVELLTPDDYAALFSAATGVQMSGAELMEVGRRIHNVEKAFNTLHAGFTRRDDYPPDRLFDQPTRSGPYKGEALDREAWGRMLDRYYSLQGWDVESGWQTEKVLLELGLPQVAQKLRRHGRLPDPG
jgi:aldehyde:ferredoxin oxidoreductase